MSKKLILNESVTRRFMRLAEIESKFTDQFLTELGEEEMELGGPEMGDEPELPGDEAPEEELPPEEVGETVEIDPNELVSDIVAALQKQGADVSMEGDEEEAPDGEEMQPTPGGEELPADEPEEELMQELEDANIKVADDEATINEVARRVAARLVAASKARR